jgi:hypothetical protein
MASLKRHIRNTLFRLGMQTTNKQVMAALQETEMVVSEELVRQVKIEMLKETHVEPTKVFARLAWRPQKIPPRGR